MGSGACTTNNTKSRESPDARKAGMLREYDMNITNRVAYKKRNY